MKARIWNPKTVFYDYVANRKIIYFDQNAWINLRDGTDVVTLELLKVLERCVTEKRIVLPLSFAAVMECSNISNLKTRATHAEMLDRFSGGVVYRIPDVIFRHESITAIQNVILGQSVPCEVDMFFSLLPDHIGSSSIVFEDSQAGARQSQFLVDYIRGDPKFRSLSFLLNCGLKFDRHAQGHKNYEDGMKHALKASLDKYAQMPKQQKRANILLRERMLLLEKHLYPAFDALLAGFTLIERIDFFKELNSKIGEGGEKRIRDLFSFMPAMDQYAQLHLFNTIDAGRRPVYQDFYDTEHCCIPSAYSDVFVTMDNRVLCFLEASKNTKSLTVNDFGTLLDILHGYLK